MPAVTRHRATVTLAFLVFAAAGCGKGAEKIAACESAWGARLAALTEQQRLLDDTIASAPERTEAVEAAARIADATLAALTVAERDVLTYPDRVKGRVAAGKMRLASMTPLRAEAAEGALAGALKTIAYDVEVQGDYRAVAKMIAAVYDQPKAIFVDRLEVNISDEYKKWATVRARVHVYAPLAAPATGTPAGPTEEFTAATAPASPPAGCEGIESPAAQQAETARAALAARAQEAAVAAELVRREAASEARTALAADLVRRRDDNRAAFTSRADELVRKAKEAVAGFAELRFKANGEPDWR